MTYGDLLLPHAIIMLQEPWYFLDLWNELQNGRYPGLNKDRFGKLIYKAQDRGMVIYTPEDHYWRATPKGTAYVQMTFNQLKFEFQNG